MSEHNTNTARYWKRTEPDTTVVYYTTESNAAHARAEGDPRAVEVDQEQYEANVPAEAREAPYNATARAPAHKSNGATPQTPAQAVEAYKGQCLQQMIGAHQQIVGMLLNAQITHAERIFVLEMVKHELLQSMMQYPVQAQAN